MSFRVTKEEKKILEEKAGKNGYQTVTEYVLACCFEKDEKEINKADTDSLLTERVSERLIVRVTPEEKKRIIEKVLSSK